MAIKKADDTYDTGQDTSNTILRFKAVQVFDIAQTDAEPLPEFADVKGDPAQYPDGLKAFITDQRIDFKTAPTLGGPLGLSCGGNILNSCSFSTIHVWAKSKSFATARRSVRANELLHLTFPSASV